ncbi:PfkB family carbohydrate kinase, partial [Brucella melitensis]|uniref:PfkB family carbohydrate kinase n=1 Tax=Brucella melitensis TaxID=29459 RepID=UPI001FFE900F
ISLISEPCGSVYETLLAREAPNRVMFLDPNIRAHLITVRATHLTRMKRMLALADIVKLSDEDLDWVGEKGSHDESAAEWLKLGPKLVVITKGAHGAVAYT